MITQFIDSLLAGIDADPGFAIAMAFIGLVALGMLFLNERQ